MKVPVSWLREYVAFDEPIEDVAASLVFTSCEVDRIVTRGVSDEDGNLERYLVGRVLEAGKHPNADRLQLCRVDVGEAEPRQIVCGAWNFGAGAIVAVALPGAVLPGGQRLERAKLRGETSDGMILSERELELGPDHTGIMVLSDALEPGTPLADVLPLSEVVLEIETGYNRPDLTSVYGIAREVAALTGAELAPMPGREPERAGDEAVDVRIDDLERCPRYIGRLFRDVTVRESPPWLKGRLLAGGMRPISNVVDVTNYAMLALGNPLHAFDFDTLAGGRIVVRCAEAGETIRTLDGTLRELDPDDLMIADAERSVAVAGIMGGAETEVGERTTTVLLEAANFEPFGVWRSTERLRLPTEGSNRWVKGVDPYLAQQAATFATELLVELAGARWTGHTDVSGSLPERPVVRLRRGQADRVAGLPISEQEQQDRLERLGFDVDVDGDWTVRVPTWRARDVTREADVVEEVVRFRLLDVPTTLPQRTELFGRLSRDQRLRRLVADVLVGDGFFEVYTYSLQADDPDPAALELPVPLSAQQRVLRTTLLGGLVAAAQHNVDVGNERVALFEVAHAYLPTGGALPEERWRVGGIVQGGFFRAKGAVELLFEALQEEADFVPARHPFMPTPASATVPGGWVAQLDPSRLEGEWGAFELDLAEVFARVPERVIYEDVVTFPAMKQDVAVAVSEEVSAGEIVAAAREAAGPLLREARVFDVYRGEQVGDGRKSVAIHLSFQSPERTLTDEDAAELRGRIVDLLAQRFDAELRA
jgi:phenylalanyl-tRNA synthetase beta chain